MFCFTKFSFSNYEIKFLIYLQFPRRKTFLESYDMFETFLENKMFVAGDELTMENFAIITTVNKLSQWISQLTLPLHPGVEVGNTALPR